MATEPKTLQQAILYFSNPDNCREYLIARRWPNGVTCPRCGSESVTEQPKYNRWQCASHHERRQFTLKTGTIFEDSPIGLDKWMAAMWMIVNCKNGVSSYEIHRAIGVTQKSAWFMNHRIRLALGMESSDKLSGKVEVDETYIGGKARNMHRSALAKRVTEFATPYTGRNQNIGKVAVLGLLERHGEVRTMVVPNTKRGPLEREVNKHVEQGSTVYSDALRSYNRLGEDYIHNVINHAETYVRGHIHTNGIENFWSLLKRTLGGTYISVEPFHLFRYLDEQAFRFNKRKLTDGERFSIVASQVVGKRLTLAEVTGKTDSRQPA
ncbi:MAG TPA: IS1595 family transposase [Pyrinomonadaceae bacterium]|nr:IS1595 family transposase [Pyrinomonadaceae bacterium]